MGFVLILSLTICTIQIINLISVKLYKCLDDASLGKNWKWAQSLSVCGAA